MNPIVCDQNSRYGLQEKHLLEQILTHPKGIDPLLLRKITDDTKLFWGNRGNRDSFTSKKFLPELRFEELLAAAEQALKSGPHLGPRAKLARDLEELRSPISDPEFGPMLTLKNPKDGEDPLVVVAPNLFRRVLQVGHQDPKHLTGNLSSSLGSRERLPS